MSLGKDTDAVVDIPRMAASAAAKPKAPAEEEAARFCDNHDDGRTHADVKCEACAPEFAPAAAAGAAPATTAYLCGQCDGILHLGKTRRGHARVALPPRAGSSTAPAAALDYLQGCTRFKLPWLVLSVYDVRCKGMVEFKRDAHPSARLLGAAGSATERCRFCERDLTSETRTHVAARGPALELVCNDAECEAKAAGSCGRVKDCGHACGGVAGEATCLPCFEGCDGVAGLAADMPCMICYTDTLGQVGSQ